MNALRQEAAVWNSAMTLCWWSLLLQLLSSGLVIAQEPKAAPIKVTSIQFSHTNVIEGDTVTLNCHGYFQGPLDYVTVEWRKNNQILNSNMPVSENLAQYKLVNVTRIDDGDYSCLVARGNDFKESPQLKLRTQYAATVRSLMFDKNLPVVSDVVELRCLFRQGNPPARVFMGRPGRMQPATIDTPGSSLATLRVEVASRKTAGLYSCRAESDVGFNEMARALVVRYKPEVRQVTIVNKEVRLGLGVTLKCDVADYGMPKGQISWYKKGYLRKGVSSEEMTIDKLESYQLGLYTCEVRNEHGYASQQVDLQQQYEGFVPEEEGIVAEKVFYHPARKASLKKDPIYIGVGVGAIVLLVFTVFILWYRKYQAENEADDADC